MFCFQHNDSFANNCKDQKEPRAIHKSGKKDFSAHTSNSVANNFNDWFYMMKTLMLNELMLLDNLFQTILTQFYQMVSSKQFSVPSEISDKAIAT